MKNLYLLIGNGNSIGIVGKINAYRQSIGQPPLNISLSNLFYYGDAFFYPGTNEPFLTKEHCPYLWKLGVRPKMDSAKANQIMSQIITCGNVYALAKYGEQVLSTNDFNYSPIVSTKNRPFPIGFIDDEVINELYFCAYGEFSSYIRYLMIYYNSQITDNDLLHIQVPLVTYIKTHYDEYDNIVFNSYNYDIIMERLLMLNQLQFNLGCFEPPVSKIVFYKPHGSISFFYKDVFKPDEPYRIPYNELSFQQHITTRDFKISYIFGDVYPTHNGMIPPYGEAERYEITYYQKIRNMILCWSEKSAPSDDYYIIGSAYGTFDRFELDRINTEFNRFTNVTYVNPAPNTDYEAVLSSLFLFYRQVPDFSD